MKTKRNALMKGFLSAVALLTVFHMPLDASAFDEVYDYITASIYELLGNYHFTLLPLWMVLGVFFYYVEEHIHVKENTSTWLAVFLSLCLLVGNSYAEAGSMVLLTGSIVNVIKFALALAGYTILFRELIGLITDGLKQYHSESTRKGLWSKHVFGRTFLFLFLGYSPFLLLSYPGNLCWDVIGQIEQVIVSGEYSTHHPLVHTLLVGGCVRLGGSLFHSYEVGLFLYMLVQDAMLVSALAGTLWVLAKRNLSDRFLWGILLLYLVTPAYSNMASTAIKDVPFLAFVIGYVICLALLLEDRKLLKKKGFLVAFTCMQLGVIFFRNNGMPLVVLSDVILLYYVWKKGDRQERISFTGASLGAVVAGKLCLVLLSGLLLATPGSKGEILSIPFQQTARYLQLYRQEIDEQEQVAIEKVLGDVNAVAAAYNPEISDPVKALYRQDSTLKDLMGYLKAWGSGLVKHPMVYVDAFFAHIYGWFDPTVSTAIRYETDYDVISQQGLIPNANKLVLFYYRFADAFTPLGILQNMGVAVWALFYLAFLGTKGKNNPTTAFVLVPLWISLFICMASPCFIGHPRYGFPILFTLPFLYGYILSAEER